MARPIASICCSPPLIVRLLREALLEPGKKRQHEIEIAFLGMAGAARMGPSMRFSRTRQVAEDAAALGHQRHARLDTSCGGSSDSSRLPSVIEPPGRA
jgi:hypothetical protein